MKTTLLAALIIATLSVAQIPGTVIVRADVVKLEGDLRAFRMLMLGECKSAKGDVAEKTCYKKYSVIFSDGLGKRVTALETGLAGKAATAISEMKAGQVDMQGKTSGGAVMRIVDAIDQYVLPLL